MKRGALILGALGLALLTGCSSSSSAPVDADIYRMPDGYPDVAAKCDGYGHRIYVTHDGDDAGYSISVVADSKCAKNGENR